MATTYRVIINGKLDVKHATDESAIILIELPTGDEDSAFIHVNSVTDKPLIGVELYHGEVTAGHWPAEDGFTDSGAYSSGGDEWFDELRVINEEGSFE